MADPIREPDISTDATTIAADIIAAMQAAIPGFQAPPGSWTSAAANAWAADQVAPRVALTEVMVDRFQSFGKTIIGLQQLEATYATANTTWTVDDTSGRTIPGGTQLTLRDADGNRLGFETDVDVVIPPGSTATAAGAVLIVAKEPGAAYSGLSADPMLDELLADDDGISWVSSIVVVGTSTGGEDAETDDDYITRLQARARRFDDNRSITTEDIAPAALDVAGVAAATAIDLLDPTVPDTSAEGHATVSLRDADGQPVSGGVAAEVAALYDVDHRLLNTTVHVLDPEYLTVNVTFTVQLRSDVDPVDAIDRAEAAIAAWLSPANWGLAGTGDEAVWINDLTVRFQDAVTILNNVDGVLYYTALTLNGGTANLSLPGYVGLPEPGTIAGTAA